MKVLNLIRDENQFKPHEHNHAQSLSLSQCLKRRLLISPNNGNELSLVVQDNIEFLSDGRHDYQFLSGSPILYPNEVTSAWQQGTLPLEYQQNALNQYVLLSQIKQSGEINAPLTSLPARKHQWRYQEFCNNLEGLVLDIGSDKPSHSIQLLPPKCEYIGLDPYAGQGEYRLIGLGEILPLADESIDAVTFNTSLDHILDYHTAIDEAYRVLKPSGKVVIATYAWLERATLLTDSVHFHHFREYEILGVLTDYFKIEKIKRYEDPKHATHRYGLYVMGMKQ